MLTGAAEALRQSIGAALHPTDRARRASWLDPLMCLLGPETISHALAAGEQLTLDEVVALALEPPDTGPAASTDSADPKPRPLSAREHEVAALLSLGLSNRQIAQRLVITDRTVAAHVEHILAKLGFISRTQIALWAAEHGAVVPNST